MITTSCVKVKIKIYYNKKCLALVAIIIQEILVLFLSYDSHHFQNSHHFYFAWGNGMSGLPWQLSGKKSACSSDCRRLRRHGFNPWVRKTFWMRKWQPTPVFLLGKFHGQRTLMGYSPWGCKMSDTTEWLTPRVEECLGDVRERPQIGAAQQSDEALQ